MCVSGKYNAFFEYLENGLWTWGEEGFTIAGKNKICKFTKPVEWRLWMIECIEGTNLLQLSNRRFFMSNLSFDRK